MYMSTKEPESVPLKCKNKKLKSNGSRKNANKLSYRDENQALAEEKNAFLRQLDFLNSIILDMKLKRLDNTKVLILHPQQLAS
ncbi:hypothetical protein TNCT_94781 [Trichonephila clavata]|uniref:Uncharacterized protein n=1 Tax=Trichonephila clavata TaxID=2740835 RepID=A0A8X6J3G4_TRICU|nr:hypothetical protein TNCT_94781 [Trichonephila clavata]